MISISLCMIVRDEEVVLARCLDSVRNAVDEIIIVDTGSRDGTRQVAARYTNKIYDFYWVEDFSAARNFAFEQATKEYILWMDADDVLEDWHAFMSMVAALPPEADTVMMPYQTAFDSAGRPTFQFYRERLLRRDGRARWKGAAHEAIEPFGVIVYRDVVVRHLKAPGSYTRRNLEIYRTQLRLGKPFSPRDLFYYARELYYHGEYDMAIQRLNAYLDGPGWLENRIEACLVLAGCHEAKGQDLQALRALTGSFAFDRPRAEVCCRIGEVFVRKKEWLIAAYWYEAAPACPRNAQSGAFVHPDDYGYLPCIQLALCYGMLNQPQLGRHYNDLAGTFKPEDASYLHNSGYYASILGPEITTEAAEVPAVAWIEGIRDKKDGVDA